MKPAARSTRCTRSLADHNFLTADLEGTVSSRPIASLLHGPTKLGHIIDLGGRRSRPFHGLVGGTGVGARRYAGTSVTGTQRERGPSSPNCHRQPSYRCCFHGDLTSGLILRCVSVDFMRARLRHSGTTPCVNGRSGFDARCGVITTEMTRLTTAYRLVYQY